MDTMLELTDEKPEIDIQETEFIRLLGYPLDFSLEGRPRELADWARQWYAQNGKPWVFARRYSDIHTAENGVVIDGTSFSSRRLAKQFADAGASEAFVVAVSAGEECEMMARQLWLEEKPDQYFFLEMFGSAVVEYLIAATGFRFCSWADQHRLAILPHYSPGYPEWDVSDQQRLLNIIRNGSDHPFPGKLRVLETGMLSPKKSLLAVFGVSPHPERVEHLSNLIPCEKCSLVKCQYRRAPYRRALPRIEDIQGLQSHGRSSRSHDDNTRHVLTNGAKYITSANALRKWSHERLKLNNLRDGSIEALFRYEGTTCSNLGQPLEFVYRVRIGSPESGYRIEEAHCLPSAGDEGYRYMCEYIKAGDSLIHTIANEQAMLGKPLDDILAWERPFSPTGCFCDSAGRQHKWGLVFEVIHYALVYSENGGAIELIPTKNSEMQRDINTQETTS